eukprot:CAMPEP_0182423772 /NCGR_PEP_ID=MMETSP1167-20130531/9857_1 /TAXON_ID=2988 /ORGANISM="Mallomonas Sp, Strain CCMP3275" /LENGTH=678 /DNA_ID=CAMNT_0024603045 /DNA_START=312 /DNA_END=2348 /DNA_ORIENTATION=+
MAIDSNTKKYHINYVNGGSSTEVTQQELVGIASDDVYEKAEKDQSIINEFIDASSEGEVDTIKDMLGTRPDIINSKDQYGKTAILRASENGEADCVQLLLTAGSRADNKDNNGKTALTWASENSETECMGLLICARAEVNSQDNDGRTASSWAATNGHVEALKLLYAASADFTIKAFNGLTPQMYAQANARREAVKFLTSPSTYIDPPKRPDPPHRSERARVNTGTTKSMMANEMGKYSKENTFIKTDPNTSDDADKAKLAKISMKEKVPNLTTMLTMKKQEEKEKEKEKSNDMKDTEKLPEKSKGTIHLSEDEIEDRLRKILSDQGIGSQILDIDTVKFVICSTMDENKGITSFDTAVIETMANKVKEIMTRKNLIQPQKQSSPSKIEMKKSDEKNTMEESKNASILLNKKKVEEKEELNQLRERVQHLQKENKSLHSSVQSLQTENTSLQKDLSAMKTAAATAATTASISTTADKSVGVSDTTKYDELERLMRQHSILLEGLVKLREMLLVDYDVSTLSDKLAGDAMAIQGVKDLRRSKSPCSSDVEADDTTNKPEKTEKAEQSSLPQLPPIITPRSGRLPAIDGTKSTDNEDKSKTGTLLGTRSTDHGENSSSSPGQINRNNTKDFEGGNEVLQGKKESKTSPGGKRQQEEIMFFREKISTAVAIIDKTVNLSQQ